MAGRRRPGCGLVVAWFDPQALRVESSMALTEWPYTGVESAARPDLGGDVAIHAGGETGALEHGCDDEESPQSRRLADVAAAGAGPGLQVAGKLVSKFFRASQRL
jgi:hypothetical protein